MSKRSVNRAKVDVAKTWESYYNEIVSSTLSLLTVIFEDFGYAVDTVETYSQDADTVHHASKTVLLNQYYVFGKNGLVSTDDILSLPVSYTHLTLPTKA